MKMAKGKECKTIIIIKGRYFAGSYNFKAAIASGLKSTLRLKTLLTSAEVSLQVIGPEFSPQKSRISETFSKFRIAAICVRRANLSLTVFCVIPEKWLTKALVSLSS
ncbi:hypothetical protein V6Z12_A06G123300 [Gossypium hirsutum]